MTEEKAKEETSMEAGGTPDGSHALSSPDRWVDLHGDYLFRYALPRARDVQLAQDIVQETFLAALDARKAFSGRSSERTWLTGILRHKLYDVFRRRSRESLTDDVEASTDPTTGLFQEDGHWVSGRTWTADPSAAVERSEFWKTLRGCIEKLPTRLADAFVLRELEKLSSPEVCKILGVTDANLWVMLYRARVRLRGCLGRGWFGREA